MNKQFIFILGLFALGILVGVFMMKSQQDKPDDVKTANTPVTVYTDSTQVDTASAAITEARLASVETRMQDILSRLEILENTDPDVRRVVSKQSSMDEFASVVDTPVTARTRALNADTLVLAGVDPATADDIVRKKSELELGKLELRDKATREGYLGSDRYMEELRELIDTEVSLRDELGDDAYDRYLFASGQANRVRVASVMLGSAAETAGMKQGDLILSYGDERLFDWHELQEATSEGQRNEYINVGVERNGEETMMWLPRGPLGVRLTSTRVNPDL